MRPLSHLAWSVALRPLLAILTTSAILAAEARAQCVLRTFDGTANYDFLGWAVDGGMDVDGDGAPDLVVGALGYVQGGRAEVHSGRTGALLHVFPSTGLMSCALAGDVDGDGHADIVVGDLPDPSTGAGRVRVFSGATGAVLHTFTGGAHDSFGASVAGAGDVDADGFADIVAGATQSSSSAPGSGYARVLSGATGALLHEFTGAAVGDGFGSAVAGAGDADGDGRDDVVVGAWRNSQNGESSGMARVFSGATGALLHELLGGAGDLLGQSVAGARDVDGDGRADLLVGAPGDSTAAGAAGKVLVVSGATGATIHSFFGAAPSHRLGSAVASAGDVDGDGTPDVAALRGGGSSAAHVWSGADGSLFLSVGGVHLVAIAGAGDVDGDGLDDVLVGDPILGPYEKGRATVFSGPAAVPTTYCTAKASSLGCMPAIASSGTPSSSSMAPFPITASGIASNQGGVLFYGTTGPAAIPFQGGTLCVQPPTARTPPQTSGGNPPSDCTGSFAIDFNAWIQAGQDPALAAGTRVHAQYWYRDPGASFTSGLTDAVQFTICAN